MAALADLENSTAGASDVTAAATAGPRPRGRREHLLQIDLIRIVAIVAVVATHVVIFSQPANTAGSQALTVALHVSRFAFFFITAFVLYLTSGSRPVRVLPWWRKRFWPVLVPYVAWTLIYWQLNRVFPWGGYAPTVPAALSQLGQNLLQGWFQLYFLIVTMQLYLAFPVIAWIVRRTRGHHLLLLVVTGALQVVMYAYMQYWWWTLPGFLRWTAGHAQVELWSYLFFFFVGAVAAAHKDQLIAVLRRYPRRLALLAVGLLAVAFGFFGLNLLFGEGPSQAAGVFQPGTLFSFLGAMLGLGLIAQHLADTRSAQSWVWRAFKWGGEISFGIYLSHMVALQFVVLLGVHHLLGLNLLPVPLYGVVVWVVAVGATMLLVSVLRHLPLATALTGRARRPLSALKRAPAPAAATAEQRPA